MGPQATIFGPSFSPRAIASRSGNTSAATSPMSRIPSTPLATSIFRSRGASRKWECMSHRPGMTNSPAPSITLAPEGAFRLLAGPTEAISRPRIRMVMSRRGFRAPGSTIVTCVIAISLDCATTHPVKNNKALAEPSERRNEKEGMRFSPLRSNIRKGDEAGLSDTTRHRPVPRGCELVQSEESATLSYWLKC